MGTQKKSKTYEEFVEKFKPKKTTDDCFTPPIVYNAIADWVAAEYGLDREKFLRPFFPGGDYENADYPADCVVVDNPPFSIISKIARFYCERGIRFFLFAPTLTLFSSGLNNATYLPIGVGITYENGAVINTSFITNLEPHETLIRGIPELYQIVKRADEENTKQNKVTLPKYDYPDHVLTASMCNYMTKNGVPFSVNRADACFIRSLDSQKPLGKTLFGAGFLLSEKAAAEKAAAEKAAAEKANATIWKLSDREKEIIKGLGRC